MQAPAPHLDGKHVVFGKVTSGMDLLHRMERVGTREGRPTVKVTVADSGELPMRR
jgi:cyclophilin family peptidyl-prolyl cis-trans isomerase